MKVRVYEIAKERGVDSRTAMTTLRRIGFVAASASTVVPPEAAHEIRTRPGLVRPIDAQKTTRFELEEWWTASHWWRYAPDRITTGEAALACQVTPATIRQWVKRGHLKPTGQRGRTLEFAPEVVRAASEAVAHRCRASAAPLPLDSVARGQARAALITVADAAKLTGVAPSTIRMWVHRGHLHPRSRLGAQNLFTVADVHTAARRR